MAVTDEMLVAYLDGELSREDRATVEAAVAADPELAERLRRHRAVGSMIHGAFSGIADEPVPPSLARAVKAPAAVVSLQAARAKRAEPASPRKPAFRLPALDPRWAGIVAGLAAGVALGLFIPRPEKGLIDSEMNARSVLAASLETQLAAGQKPDVTIQVGLTFQDRDKAWCRTFAARQGLSGVACRSRDGWRVRVAEAGPAAAGGGDRTAGSATSPAVLAAVEGMIAGAPVDAAAERKARASGWR